MKKQYKKISRRETQPSRATAAADDSVRIVNATLWRSEDEAKAWLRMAAHAVEPSLLPPTPRLERQFESRAQSRDYVRHLERRILRRPRDLKAHVRRILKLHALGDSEDIAGALADLFIVLGKHGHALRARLLCLVQRTIDDDDARYFRAHLDNGPSLQFEIRSFSGSRLSRHIDGTTCLVVLGDTAGTSAIDTARSSIAAGRLSAARELLEGLLDQDPGDPAVSELLLDLYEDNGLRQEFLKTYTRFLGRPLAQFNRWAGLAARFKASDPADERITELPDLAERR